MTPGGIAIASGVCFLIGVALILLGTYTTKHSESPDVALSGIIPQIAGSCAVGVAILLIVGASLWKVWAG